MSTPTLWLSFLDGAMGGPAPRLRAGSGPGASMIELTDRARWVLAAISLPRELAPETVSDELQRTRLGSWQWSSGEITARIPYQHRSTIRHALGDLRGLLGERDLALEDYLVIDTGRGRYGVRDGRVAVDLVELHHVRNDPDALDRFLDGAVGDRRRARLAAVCAQLLDPTALTELEQAIAASAARAADPRPEPAPPSLDETVTAQPAADDVVAAPAGPAPAGPARSRPAPRRRWVLLPAIAAILAAAVAFVLLRGGDRATATVHANGPPRAEVSGGLAHTWSDPITAGGHKGHEIFGGERVVIACRTHGFVVQDGNRWWYLIDSKPWSRHFFVTADAFYNNGRTRGSLRGSAFVDPKVATCSPLPRSMR